jgi:hypothetical protein
MNPESNMPQTTIPPALLERIEQAAEKNGVTPAELLEGWLEREEKDRSWQALLGYGQDRAAKLGIKPEDVDRLIHEFRSEARGR